MFNVLSAGEYLRGKKKQKEFPLRTFLEIREKPPSDSIWNLKWCTCIDSGNLFYLYAVEHQILITRGRIYLAQKISEQ